MVIPLTVSENPCPWMISGVSKREKPNVALYSDLPQIVMRVFAACVKRTLSTQGVELNMVCIFA